MKNKIRLTESQLHNIIKESVKRILREDNNKTIDLDSLKTILGYLDGDYEKECGDMSLNLVDEFMEYYNGGGLDEVMEILRSMDGEYEKVCGNASSTLPSDFMAYYNGEDPNEPPGGWDYDDDDENEEENEEEPLQDYIDRVNAQREKMPHVSDEEMADIIRKALGLK